MNDVVEYRAPGSEKDLHLLFEDMKKELAWRPAGKEPLAGHTRKECFAGAVIGLDDREPMPGRSMNISKKKRIKFNDPANKTRLEDFENFAQSNLPRRSRALFLAICDAAFKRLKASLLKSNVATEELTRSLMQCNINMYRKEDSMIWHRDDITEFRTPMNNTFQPASLTCILTNNRIANSEEVGLHVALPEISKKAVFFDGNELKFARKPILRGIHGSMILLSKAAYTEGLHTAGTNWESESSDFERITINFRLVLPEIWARLHQTQFRE